MPYAPERFGTPSAYIARSAVTRARAPRQVIISAIALARAVPPDFQMLRIVQVRTAFPCLAVHPL